MGEAFEGQRELVQDGSLPPAGRDGARPLQRAEQPGGGVRLGRGFRQPNSVSEFGASVKVTPPYGCNASSAQQRADVGIGPYERREGSIDHLGQRRRAERLQRGCEEGARIAAEIIPKGSRNSGQSLSHGCAVTAPFAQGSLWDGGCGLPHRFAPCNDSLKPLSFRGGPTGRCGNPSFYDGRGTGVRAAVPRAWPPPTKFRTKIWSVGQVIGPYERSTEVPSTGRSRHRPLRKAQSTTQAGRRAAKRPRLRPRGMGGNRRKDHPKRGPLPRLPRQRLAKRKARKEKLVKFGLCPIPSECSTAYHVRKSEQNPARAPVGAASTEQNGLGPHPAAREGAPRP